MKLTPRLIARLRLVRPAETDTFTAHRVSLCSKCEKCFIEETQ